MASENVHDIYIPIAALQHYAYCPRQCALIHLEQIWTENYLTAQGRLLHERVDSYVNETRGSVRTERGVDLISHHFRLVGKLDLLEITNTCAKEYKPVEYKRGKPKIHDWDKIQLCGQVLCLEEMLNIQIREAAIWYWQVRHRETVPINNSLRENTKSVISSVHSLFLSTITPYAKHNARLCGSCSLFDDCGVKNFANDYSKSFINEIYTL